MVENGEKWDNISGGERQGEMAWKMERYGQKDRSASGCV